jgi:hypothetical protein
MPKNSSALSRSSDGLRQQLFTLCVGWACATCACGTAPAAKVEVDHLKTINAVIGGDPLVTAILTNCVGSPEAIAYAGSVTVAHELGVTLFRTDDGTLESGAYNFQLLLDSTELRPSRFGLPVTFDLEIAVRCDGAWIRSAPYAMQYVPTAASLAPPFSPGHFWAGDREGDVLACDDTHITSYIMGSQPSTVLELGFPCGTADFYGEVGARRFARSTLFGIAAVDPGPVLAWARPTLLIDAWTDAAADPVVVRVDAGTEVLAVLDAATGLDVVGPLTLTRPLPHHTADAGIYGVVTRAESGDLLVIETELITSPASLSCFVQRYSAGGADLGEQLVVHYDWQASSRKCDLVEFDALGDHVYVMSAPVDEATAWIDKIRLADGVVVWSTPELDGWRYPLGEIYGRLLAASDKAFVWIDSETGAVVSSAFAPDSGNAFLYGLVEPDGSMVMLADPVGGVAQGLYLFAPDGTSTLRFSSPSALFRWVTPGWSSGTLVSYYDELHWLYARAQYDSLLVQP